MKRRIYQRQREEAKKRNEILLRQEAENLALVKRLNDRALRMRKLRHEEYHGMDYYVFEKGKITGEKGTGIWHRDGDDVYIRCIGCLNIIKIGWDDIDEQGVTENCLICPSRQCHMHQYIKFKGFWDKEVPKK